jgi:phosphohistidine swiveling domain-containing protein
MNGPRKAERQSVPQGVEGVFDDVIRSLSEQLTIIQGRPERVAECCLELERNLSTPPCPSDIVRLLPLLPLLAEHSGPVVVPLFDFLERIASSAAAPWSLLGGMLAARDKALVVRSLQLTEKRISDGGLAVDRGVVGFLAGLMDHPGGCIGEPDCFPAVARIVRRLRLAGRGRPADRPIDPPVDPPVDPAQALFLQDDDEKVRSLAARILDLPGEPVPPELALKALGREAYDFLAPYLVFARASHADVACLLPSPGARPPALASLRRAEAALGKDLLRKVIADAGWPRLNAGVEVRRYVRLTVGDSLPLFLHPPEATLAAQCGDVRISAEEFIVIVEGGTLTLRPASDGKEDPASRFRSYNLTHADVLGDFLAIAPLTAERVHGILRRMDSIVADYIGLFSSLSDECGVLRDIYDRLKSKIIAGIGAAGDGGSISPDLTRLTVMFEDPRSLGQVRTLHGLKRYLHQKGLQLGFKLVQRTRSTNRTVGLMLASGDRILNKVDAIRYSDFEPDTGGGLSSGRMPYAVSLAADGFARQLLYGQESFPRVDIFCYGNEVHYYLAFGNHPAFLRINYAPPLQGGMVDLEYYGVSKYDLASHPDFSLGALQLFFRALGFHVDVENTRVHARFDKEHTPDLKSLCEKAAAIFCLAPYLLDIDWTIGGLTLDADARRAVAAGWADSFAAWGALPLRTLLTEDRQSVVESIASTPAGRQEVVWTGKGTYRDRFSFDDGDFFRNLYARAAELHPDIGPMRPEKEGDRMGQLRLEHSVLVPLREAAGRGELVATPAGYARTPAELFQRVAGPEQFAGLIADGGEPLESAATLAYLLAPLERYLNFHTTGSVGGFDVQSARLSLHGEDLGVHLLRGERNLAFHTRGTVLFQRRADTADPWESNASCNVGELLALLRRANYPVPGLGQVPRGLAEDVSRIREALAEALPPEPRVPIPGDRTIDGLRASPGRAVGRVLFGTEGRAPVDFEGAVLVTPALQASDGAFLHRAAGVVSTGGGILSHAALLAAQFHKPAIIIEGHWEPEPGGGRTLHYTSTEYQLEGKKSHGYHIWSRNNMREIGHVLREGDLVALDANEDVLRVLGQERDTLALHDGFRQFGLASRDLAGAANDRDILLFRGRRIRARHQIEKVLPRLADPVLACHAIHELLLDSGGMGRNATGSEKAGMLDLILHNPQVSKTARNHLRWTVRELRQRLEKAVRSAKKRMPDSDSIYEVLSLRLDVLRASQSFDEVGPCLEECGLDTVAADRSLVSDIERLALGRIASIREGIAATLVLAEARKPGAPCRHLLRKWKRSDRLVAAPEGERQAIEALRTRLAESDDASRTALAARTIIRPEDGGLELFPFIGWKGANLAEIEIISGKPSVPPWFAVTDLAFREVLRSPVDRVLSRAVKWPADVSTIQEAIGAILAQPKADHLQRSSQIRSLWESIVLPERLAGEITAAYRRL